MRLLVIMICLALFVPACGSKHVEGLKAAVVDCTTAEVTRTIDEFRPLVVELINGTRSPTGSLDVDKAIDRLKTFGLNTGGCVAADVVASVLSGRRSAAGAALSPVEAATLFDGLRARLWPETRFKTEAGIL